MIQIPITNDIPLIANKVIGSDQVAMNITANHVQYVQDPKKRTSGLVYNDFLVAGSVAVLIHGKIISCFDIVNRSNRPVHFTSTKNDESDLYNFDHEPKFIWMQDKKVKYTVKRWKIIIYFRNKDLK
jgi:hypothetical protein